MKLKPIKVSLLNQYIKKYLNSNNIFNNLRVEGEVSNVRTSKSGYTYFTLCDETSNISCVCFYINDEIIDGDKIIVDGELSVYEARGTYQIVVRETERIGYGNILKELELLKERLKEKGYFEKKLEVPLVPSKVGVITSKSGAAIQDILKTFESVNGSFEVIIYNSLVQGNDAKQSIIDGIKYFNNKEVTDVLLLSRGGGSFEDLSIFNNVEIAEELFMSKVPVVTGIGHETDRTLCDYVSDMYCHTPTAAAEYIIRGYRKVENELKFLSNSLHDRTDNKLRMLYAELRINKYILRSFVPNERLQVQKNELMNLNYILKESYNKIFKEKMNDINILYEKLRNMDYKNQLQYGYSLVLDTNNDIIKDINQVSKDQSITILMNKFSIEANVNKVSEV